VEKMKKWKKLNKNLKVRKPSSDNRNF